MKFCHQHDERDCGPASLCMIASYFKKNIPIQFLREISYLSKDGVSLLSISEAANQIGLETVSAKLTIKKLVELKEELPCILHWNQRHFVVIEKINRNIFTKKYKFHILDPSHGPIVLNENTLQTSWLSDNDMGVAMFFSPTDKFYDLKYDEVKLKINFMVGYLKPFKIQLGIMFFLMLLGSFLTLLFPYLTQNLIDKGVNAKDLNFIQLILISQLVIYIGYIILEILRNWIMLYLGTKLSITIISDFLKKLLKLPLKYFDAKSTGDFNQRIQDNERIEYFLTSQSLLTFFSIITFFVFFGVLWNYNFFILLIYIVLTSISITWAFYWLKKRKILDYFKFNQKSETQEHIYEIINGVTEMKLNQFEDFKRQEWEKTQNKLFKINIRILKIDQIQMSGFEFINQVKNILVTFLASTLVVKGKMTLGELLSVSYIVGQMNSPVNQLVNFFRSLQDAKLSLERLNEVQNHEPEENESLQSLTPLSFGEGLGERTINIKNLSYQYEGPKSPFVLRNINFSIPEGKVTAIVGASGSGKTTLMKLLLRFYDPIVGQIFYEDKDITTISPNSIRENTGAVMQDGYIFSDTIERNIATGDENIDIEKLQNAIKIANIEEFIKNLPLGFNTKIGASGNGISGGQKQRLLIARAVYKNPHYLFFDEATSALDAENEKVIHDNLQEFFKGKTVLIIAHRLSTVKNADQIVVLKNGEIVEIGNHTQLVQNKADYYNLVKNQLELGS